MANDNCLEGIQCPRCGNEDRFIISARVMVEVTDDGADVASPKFGNGFEWDKDSYTRCPECDWEGSLKDFELGHAQDGLETAPLPSPSEIIANAAAHLPDSVGNDHDNGRDR